MIKGRQISLNNGKRDAVVRGRTVIGGLELHSGTEGDRTEAA